LETKERPKRGGGGRGEKKKPEKGTNQRGHVRRGFSEKRGFRGGSETGGKKSRKAERNQVKGCRWGEKVDAGGKKAGP